MGKRSPPTTSVPKPYANPYLAGAALGLVLLSSFVILGAGLGAFSTAALLYGGAAAVGMLSRQRIEREAEPRGSGGERREVSVEQRAQELAGDVRHRDLLGMTARHLAHGRGKAYADRGSPADGCWRRGS